MRPEGEVAELIARRRRHRISVSLGDCAKHSHDLDQLRRVVLTHEERTTHGDLGKKIYATTLCSLMLTVYYRYLPMTSKGGAKKAAAKAPVKAAPADGEEVIDIF